MHLLPDPQNSTITASTNTVTTPISQSLEGSGSSFEPPLGADWTNTIIAVLALLFTILTYILQERKNRIAAAEQADKDRLNKIELEKLRQQTIRLEWYKDTVKSRLDLVYASFDELLKVRSTINDPQLTEEQKSELQVRFRVPTFRLRNDFLEPLFFIHIPTYRTLLESLDEMADGITNAIFNDELQLTNSDIYEREIGSKIKNCQQKLFKTLYNYRGEE